MRQSDRESVTDSDPHGLFFGSEDDPFAEDEPFFDDEPAGPLPVVQRVSRSEQRAQRSHRHRRKRNGRFALLLALLLVGVVAVATWLVVLPIYRYLNPSDYSGSGHGAVVIQVQSGDGADAIGQTLYHQHVVASVKAFTNAAKDNSASQNIQPGSYQMKLHMSAKSALALLLNPASRINSNVVVTEGATTLDVIARLTAPPCPSTAPSTALCGPGMNKAAVLKTMDDVAALGLPTDYLVNGKNPSSVEGFLFPATYLLTENTSPSDALGQMITQFVNQVRSTNFSAAAAANHITPYQQLIIASIAQSEAKFPADFAKVARVLLNRLAAGMPLQVDATSAYAAKLQGLDPTKVIYAQLAGPYNTYKHAGLPPTPISNPGAEAMAGAAQPAAGNWLYYVNGDAAGNLFFTNSQAAFAAAVAKCQANHWGCG